MELNLEWNAFVGSTAFTITEIDYFLAQKRSLHLRELFQTRWCNRPNTFSD